MNMMIIIIMQIATTPVAESAEATRRGFGVVIASVRRGMTSVSYRGWHDDEMNETLPPTPIPIPAVVMCAL